ncbi:MAG: hypothetical protein MESAZ_02234 [Saezia sanguinis]
MKKVIPNSLLLSCSGATLLGQVVPSRHGLAVVRRLQFCAKEVGNISFSLQRK